MMGQRQGLFLPGLLPTNGLAIAFWSCCLPRAGLQHAKGPDSLLGGYRSRDRTAALQRSECVTRSTAGGQRLRAVEPSKPRCRSHTSRRHRQRLSPCLASLAERDPRLRCRLSASWPTNRPLRPPLRLLAYRMNPQVNSEMESRVALRPS